MSPEPVIPPFITRIKIATIGAPDVAKVEAWYTQWLGYRVVEKGRVSSAMAKSWGAPKSANRAYITLASDGAPDVFIRAVEIDAIAGYKPLTTFGWNAIEIVVDDLVAVEEKIAQSPFTVIGPSRPLTAFPSIRAMQVVGPAQEVVYLTTETGDRTKSPLPQINGMIGRPFIMVLASSDANAAAKFYMDRFLMRGGNIRPIPVDIIAAAQGLPPDHGFPLGLVRAAEHGNNIEMDGYSDKATPRPKSDGQLPPGVAMTSFSVNSLDGLKADFISSPQKLYGDMRAATFIGPAGELTELIEEPRL
jgi:catechol 2,3-dioxygenase-like lactoylglutathione lyase family enzyme